MTCYETLKDRPKRFLSLTGYILEEFRHFCRPVPSDFWSSSKYKHLMANPERNVGIRSIRTVAYRLTRINHFLF